MYKAIIVDDETNAIELLKHYLSDIPEIEVVGTYTDPALLIKEIKNIKYDVIFLDVEMPYMSGVDIAKKLFKKSHDIAIIFVTAYREYAYEAFMVSGVDYLLKPISKEKLKNAIKKIDMRKKNIYVNPEEKKIIFKMMRNLEIISGDKNIATTWRTQKAKEIFTYLLHNHPYSVDKSQLISDVWPDRDEKSATRDLHTSIYHLRLLCSRLFNKEVIQLKTGQYNLDIELDSDVIIIEAMTSFEKPTSVNAKKLLDLYRGAYLEIESYDWANKKRELLERNTLHFFENYIITASSEPEKDVAIQEQVLLKMMEMDCYNEVYLVFMLEHYYQQRNIYKFTKVYKDYCEMLHKDLNIEISDKTAKIVNNIKDNF